MNRLPDPPEQRSCAIRVENLTLMVAVDVRHSEILAGDETRLSALRMLHTHSFCELFCCYAGAFTIRLMSGDLTVNAGDLAVIPPGLPHVKLPADPDASWNSISFSCKKRRTRGGYDLFGDFSRLCTGKLPLSLRSHSELCDMAVELTERLKSGKTRPDASKLALRLADLLARMMEAGLAEGCTIPPVSSASDSDISRISRLENLISTRFMEPLTADGVAAALYISKRQLSRVVRKRYGKTLRQVIIGCRIELAGQLLRNTSLSAEAVSRAVGFSSNVSFYREFERANGVSPRSYRLG